jgi:hypothetical protein
MSQRPEATLLILGNKLNLFGVSLGDTATLTNVLS